MRMLVLALALLTGCSDDALPTGTNDLSVPSDLAVGNDLAPSGCPPTFQPTGGGHCAGNAVCRYPTDAGPYNHMSCNGVIWQSGNCPFGPGYTTEFSGCIGECYEHFGEAWVTCQCLADGTGVCCVYTGGEPTCGNFDGGS